MGFPFDMYEDMFKKKTGAECLNRSIRTAGSVDIRTVN